MPLLPKLKAKKGSKYCVHIWTINFLEKENVNSGLWKNTFTGGNVNKWLCRGNSHWGDVNNWASEGRSHCGNVNSSCRNIAVTGEMLIILRMLILGGTMYVNVHRLSDWQNHSFPYKWSIFGPNLKISPATAFPLFRRGSGWGHLNNWLRKCCSHWEMLIVGFEHVDPTGEMLIIDLEHVAPTGKMLQWIQEVLPTRQLSIVLILEQPFMRIQPIHANTWSLQN